MVDFSDILTNWYSNNQRDLPWRKSVNPYDIWLSEIILQQTRVAQGLSYYLKFKSNYPEIKDLAAASEDEVLAHWKGLGYYSRGRNLRKAAIQVMEEFDGVFPQSFKELKKLKGVGDYSAAAIASFAYREKIAVVDGNVYRVLSRLFNINTPIDSTEGKKYFSELANELISDKYPDTHNQAIMEFGAMQCKPKSPDCSVCPFMDCCEAFANDTIKELPFKAKKIKRKSRFFEFHFFEKNGSIEFEKRGEKDIWANMFQFPLIETPKASSTTHEVLWEVKHVLSHQDLYCKFVRVKKASGKGKMIPVNDLEKFAFPRVIENFLERYYN